jgi:N-methylhydantoinase B/oxoprolinase/acetone carboxylase alpha subunit
MKGGDPGSRGLNMLTLKSDGRTISLGGKNTVTVQPGDVLTIFTPGGGGFGSSVVPGVSKEIANAEKKEPSKSVSVMSSGSLYQYTLNQESV